MNTEEKPVHKLRGERCEHTFLEVGSEIIRSVRPLTPERDERGYDKTGPCPLPKCHA